MPIKIKRRTVNVHTKPTMYNTPTVDKFIKKILEGNTLRSICSDKSMPSIATVYKWMDKYPEFDAMYQKAKELQMDILVDEMLDISRDVAVHSESIQKAKLTCDTLKWQASKFKAKKYGDKLALTGDDGKALIPPKLIIDFGGDHKEEK